MSAPFKFHGQPEHMRVTESQTSEKVCRTVVRATVQPGASSLLALPSRKYTLLYVYPTTHQRYTGVRRANNTLQ